MSFFSLLLHARGPQKVFTAGLSIGFCVQLTPNLLLHVFIEIENIRLSPQFLPEVVQSTSFGRNPARWRHNGLPTTSLLKLRALRLIADACSPTRLQRVELHLVKVECTLAWLQAVIILIVLILAHKVVGNAHGRRHWLVCAPDAEGVSVEVARGRAS